VDGDLLVSEYLARVAPHQAEAQQPAAKRERPAPVETTPAPPRRQPAQLPSDASEDLPDYTISRARSEYEKANLLELQRKEKEGQLAHIEDMEMGYNAVLLQLTTKAGSLHKQIKAAIPHLTHRELEKIERMIADVFEAVASHGFEDLPE